MKPLIMQLPTPCVKLKIYAIMSYFFLEEKYFEVRSSSEAEMQVYSYNSFLPFLSERKYRELPCRPNYVAMCHATKVSGRRGGSNMTSDEFP
jgi:hypothetical protein